MILILAAFAAAFSISGAGGAAPAFSEGWTYGETVDPMSDEKNARAFAQGDNGAIGIKCDSPGADSLYVHYVSETFLGGRGGRGARRELMIRFDNDPPSASTWFYSDSSAILTNKAEVWAFVERLQSAKTLAVRATTYDYRQVTTVVDVSGAAPEIAKVIATCRAERA